jgi:FkbM family methyltransferase
MKACEKSGFQCKEIINFDLYLNNPFRSSEEITPFDHVRCRPYGLWSHKSGMRFSNPNPSSAGTVGYLNTEENMEGDMVSLGDRFQDTEISLIKKDVEGAEMEALRGRAETIKRFTPKLAVSAYHKRKKTSKLHSSSNVFTPDISPIPGTTVLLSVRQFYLLSPLKGKIYE